MPYSSPGRFGIGLVRQIVSRALGGDVMKTEPEHSNNTSNTGKRGNLKSKYSYCASGHRVVWYIEPPPECPHCNAKLLPGHSFRRTSSFPWLSAYKYG